MAEANAVRQGIRWRRVFRIVHRDAGYLVFTLTVLYAVSGVAVNHVGDWNPNYGTTESAVGAGPLEGLDLQAMEQRVVAAAGLAADEVRGHHRPAPETFIVFLPDGGEVRVDVASGEGRMKRIRRRPILFESNVLHLNHVKGVWTWVADAYAVTLFLLALTGIVLLKGAQGLAGRGKWFVLGGTLLPAVFIAWYYISRAR